MKFFLSIILLIALQQCGNTEDITGTYQVATLNSETVSSEKATITFDKEKQRVYGNSGCNNFSGIYTIEGETVKFGQLLSTKMACPDMETEQQLFDALGKVSSFSIKNGVLTLKNNDNTLLTANKTKAMEKEAEKTTEQNNKTIEYSAVSRGYFMSVTLEGNNLSVTKQRGGKPTAQTLSDEQKIAVSGYLNKVDVKGISQLEAPSKAHQYDGAPLANLKITSNGETYQSVTFDHGNPPAEIADLVNHLLSLAGEK